MVIVVVVVGEAELGEVDLGCDVDVALLAKDGVGLVDI